LLTTNSRISGGAILRQNATPHVAFLGLNAEAGGYMGLNACIREVADLTWGCVAGSAEAAANFLTRQIEPSGTVPASWKYVIAPAALLEAPHGFDAPLPRPNVETLGDPYANPNLRHDQRPYAIRAACQPLHCPAPVRVAFVSHNLDFEGAPITLRDLVLGLKATGAVDAIVMSPTDGPLRDHFEREGVQVLLEPSLRVPENDAEAEIAGRTLSLNVMRLAPRVVVANTIRMTHVVTASTKVRVPSLLLQHESEAPETYFDYLPPTARENAYMAFSQAYAVTYVAEATRVAWRALEHRANFHLIRNALPHDNTRGPSLDRVTARRTLALTDQMCGVLIVGAVSARKGQLDVVKAIARLSRPDRKSLHLFIVGDDSDTRYMNLIRACIEDKNIADTVTITGRVSSTALYYAACDIYVCASSLESAPRVVLQAMERGLAIVTTPVFGLSEMTTDGRDALHFPVGDRRRLAAKLRKFLRNPDLRQKFGEAARHRFSMLPTFDEMLDQYTRLIREAAAASVPEP